MNEASNLTIKMVVNFQKWLESDEPESVEHIRRRWKEERIKLHTKIIGLYTKKLGGD